MIRARSSLQGNQQVANNQCNYCNHFTRKKKQFTKRDQLSMTQLKNRGQHRRHRGSLARPMHRLFSPANRATMAADGNSRARRRAVTVRPASRRRAAEAFENRGTPRTRRERGLLPDAQASSDGNTANHLRVANTLVYRRCNALSV